MQCVVGCYLYNAKKMSLIAFWVKATGIVLMMFFHSHLINQHDMSGKLLICNSQCVLVENSHVKPI